MAELELKEVSYFYESGGKRIDILDKASYSFEKGTLYTIVGPSGSGKTTTLTLAGALEEPKSGCVCFEGKDIREIGYTRYRNSKIGIAEVILADEPTGNLDVDTAAGIVKIFKELAHEDKKCVIAVTHSEAFAAEADVVVRLEKKKLQD